MDVRTNVVVSAQTKGFDQALQKTLGMNTKALDGLKKQAQAFSSVQKEISGMEGKLGSLIKKQLDLTKQLKNVKEGTIAYNELSEMLEKVNDDSEKLEKTIRLTERAYRNEARAARQLAGAQKTVMDQQQRAQQQSKWAGTQGFFQGAAPGMAPLFLQRGPGMMRQAAGMALGGGIRRGIGAGAGMFQGIGGLQQAAAGIPVIGGFAAGQIGAAAGYAGQALQYQRQQLEALPFLGGRDEWIGSRARSATAREKLARYRATPREERVQGIAKSMGTDVTPQLGLKVTQGLLSRSIQVKQRTLLEQANIERVEAGRKYPIENQAPIPPQLIDADNRLQAVKNAYKIDRLVEKNMEQRIQEQGANQFTRIKTAGRELLGLGPQESLQQVSTLAQAGGGGPSQRFMESAFAAQRLYGVGGETAGAFLKAGRRGGLVGGMGGDSEGLTGALKDAMEMGLQGAEIPTYLQTIAQGIQSFEDTGIPINKDAIRSMGLEIGQAGITATRAARLGAGVQRTVQGIGQRGVTGGLDLMFLQEFGGYRGGGAAEYVKAITQMEGGMGALKSGNFSKAGKGSPLGNIINRLVGYGGGGAGGALFMRRQFGTKGIQMSMPEATLLAKQATGAELTEDEKALMATEAKKRKAATKTMGEVASPETMVSAARETMTKLGGNLKAHAALQSQQLAVGSEIVGVVNKLSLAAAKTNKAFMTLSGDTLESVSTSLLSASSGLQKFADEAKKSGSVLAAIGNYFGTDIEEPGS